MTARRRWRLFALLAALVALPSALVLVVVHLRPVQRWAFERAATVVAEKTGWRVKAGRVALRLWPARLEAAALEVAAGERPLVTVQRLSARWHWSALLRATPRVEALEIDGLAADLRQLPALPAGEQKPSTRDPYRVVEVGRLELRGGELAAAAAGVELAARGLKLGGTLANGMARLDLAAVVLVARRGGRSLALGSLELAARGDASGITVERCRLEGQATRLELEGVVATAAAGPLVKGTVDLDLDLGRLVDWWDPALAARLEPRGRVVVDGAVELAPGRRPVLALVHRGAPFSVAGYSIDELRVRSDSGSQVAELAGRGWGRVSATLVADNAVRIEATLDRAPLGPALALAPVALPARLPQPITLSGTAGAVVTLPVNLDRFEANADLTLEAPDSVVRLQGAWAERQVRLDRLELDVPGARLTAAGTARLDGEVGLRGELLVDDPALLAETAARFLPEPLPVALGGGPIAAELELAGDLRDPRVKAALRWQRPLVQGCAVAGLTASLEGTFDRLDWQADVEGTPGARFGATGTAAPRRQRVAGAWSVDAPDLAALVALARPASGLDLGGSVSGGGGFAWDGGWWEGSAALEGRRLAWGDWCLDELRVELEATPERVTVGSLEARSGAARLAGSGWGGLTLDSPLVARVTLQDLELGKLPLKLPSLAAGALSGQLDVGGTLARPTGELELGWVPAASGGQLAPIRLRAALADGLLRVVAERLETAVGPLTLEASLPLGGVPRPPWLWPGAPAGPLKGRLDGTRLRSGTLLAALGMRAPDVGVSTDLRLDVAWDLADPSARVVRLELPRLEISSPVENLAAEGPVVATLHGSQLELEPLTLSGPRSRIEIGRSSVDLATRQVLGRVEVTLDPALARLLPVPMQAQEPVRMSLDLSGQLEAPSGSFVLDHHAGRLVMREPPVELTDLHLEATLEGGTVTITAGEAGLNRGRVQIGGGWDPRSGQGVVLQLQDVTFVLANSMVTRWSGDLAVEPEPGHLARVTGELVLDGGIWDRPVDLAGALLGPSATPVAADDPTRDILVDLSLRGRGGIKVENNLGHFDVSWGVLQVRGNVAEPVFEGEVRIAPGGELALTGTPVKVRRGTIEFTGEPGAQPRVEVVPEESLAAAGQGFDAAVAAKKGLAGGLGKVLGLENETLQPAEIAVETQTDPGSRFSVGHRLSRQIALFLSTDLANPQDRVTLLQLWNLRQLPGLALQGFTESIGSNGFALIERLRWGGTEATADRPVIQRLRLVGDWPISKRRLRAATGIEQGQPYEPFLLFVAGVRMERELAAAGYYDARVEARTAGDERLPTLVFECAPGPEQRFRFTGDRVTKAARRELVGLYQPPPLADAAFELMASTLARRLAVRFPEAAITVHSEGEEVVVDVHRGRRLRLLGPVTEGVPPEVAADVALALGGAAQLSDLLRHPDQGSLWVERLVRGRGYPAARLVRVWAEPLSTKETKVHVEIELGPRATVAGVRLEGRDPLAAVGSAGSAIRPGMPLDRRAVDAAVSLLRRQYLDAGYAQVEVRARVEEVEAGAGQVVIDLQPGTQRTVEKIEFTGLRHLSERLLGRTLPLKEGDLLDPDQLDRGVSQLAAFAPVERVEASTEPGRGSGTKVEIAVTEKSRWTAGGGLRWSSDFGSQVVLDLRDDDLLHRGVSTSLRGSWDRDHLFASVVAALPPPPGGRFSFAAVLSYSKETRVDPVFGLPLQETVTSAGLDGSYRLTQQATLRSYLKLDRVRTFDPNAEPDDPFAVDITDVFSIVGAQLIRDRLDDPFDPHRGDYLACDLSASSQALASDVSFVRALLTDSLVLEPRRGWTWAQTLRLGIADPLGGTLPQSERVDARFYAGGETSVRGFRQNFVGPVEDLGGLLYPAGGGALVILNEELRANVWQDLRLAVFVDSGQVWDRWRDAGLDLAVGAGLGLRYLTPVGPVWADVAWPVMNRGYSEGARYYFGIGRTF